MSLTESNFQSTDELNIAFAERIVDILKTGITENGRASLVVSGGRTPKALFNALSKVALDWAKVDVSLADERWVETDDDASNEKMLRRELLQHNAAVANFVGLKTEHADAKDAVETCTANLARLRTPFDVLILGMGEDGHTASLFPCSEQIHQGLDQGARRTYIAVQPTTAPNQRMSLTLPALLNSKHIFLHLTGASKKQVLDEALKGGDEHAMPIRAVLNNADVELMWAP
ncbi:6-phosphogluconolactonase [Paraglaciecola polaris]|uniref:6-phosphogluconolactonase n=1 Tax=Paraglaciecola polaris LMG 21857 TaxID=1129793 RepID=K6ZQJ9_9ALTE|nr:6-phosphogluconolactonase [Paraglaciecola polaris]GAC32557.1 6-phosphogluconolactonase [Paraglaciecola polaris LMG 21857]|tara:strand:+ start:14166 stop:14858 length:693 start_codon:yes stop_codon:yes gene_type:complete